LKGRGADATIFLEMIKEVEAAVGSRKGRTGTAAGDVAFPKGKENLASVLKRYKRRLANKPPGSLVLQCSYIWCCCPLLEIVALP
jgi:ethylene-insensitive protein 2